LLQRWYDADAGVAQVGGIAIRDYQLKRGLLPNMGLVLQQPDLFNISIHDNIAWGLPKSFASAEAVIAAARSANAHEFIQRLPLGNEPRGNTRLNERV